MIGGANAAINVKEKPFWLERENDYPSLLKWISLQPIIFYDSSHRRAWLVDGASALLHLVRMSLHLDENEVESTFDWMFDPSTLQGDWSAFAGRQAALRTLKNWDNLNMNLYVTSQKVVGGEIKTEYATLETRVLKIMHCLEILVDRQVKVASQDGLVIPQAFDTQRTVVGFDTLDILNPLGPILPRIQQLNASGYGWRDLVSAMGITTIFGSDFGDLIRPGEPSSVCPNWRSLPSGSDYLAASHSTLKMLHERRLTRMWPGLAIGEVTEKIIWLSATQLSEPCNCLASQGHQAAHICQMSPVQYLMSKKLRNLRSASRSMTPVDISRISPEGAVIFGYISLFNIGGGSDAPNQQSHERHERLNANVSVVSSRISHNSSQLSPGTNNEGSSSERTSVTSQPSIVTTLSGSAATGQTAGMQEVVDSQGQNIGRKRWKDLREKSKGLSRMFSKHGSGST